MTTAATWKPTWTTEALRAGLEAWLNAVHSERLLQGERGLEWSKEDRHDYCTWQWMLWAVTQ